jgi:hypothetical protein
MIGQQGRQRGWLILVFGFVLTASSLPGCNNSTEAPEVAPEPVSAAVVAHRDWAVPDMAPGGVAFGSELVSALKNALDTKPAEYVARTHHLNDDGSPKYTNRLILETSPYLLQHAHNPVNWNAWGEEAFATARELDRPILLSIGYSTCHWCHVMERESFEDIEIATFMNENFICIKVDREERPDIDGVYMDAVRMLTGRGGWPMTTALTPDGEVFFGGTYFPPRDGVRGSRVGFLTILGQLAYKYANERDGLLASAAELTTRMRNTSARQRPGDVPGVEAIDSVHERLSRSFDEIYGGFGRAPKFPRSVTVDLLMRYHRRSGNDQALHMAVYTLERMAAGGMYDHVGGGFHRYSTDARWLVPHFEKMLYDNAQLAVSYLEAYQITGEENHARVVIEILDYVAREMTSPEGGFYSATDADSPTPAGHEEEGWFFTWTPAELAAILDASDLDLIRDRYGVTDRGNFENRNILYAKRKLEHVASDAGMTVAAARDRLDAARKKLYDERLLRPPPGKDTKVLTAWNGLMISAFARASLVLDRTDYRERAETAAAFILDEMRDGARLYRSWRGGQARHWGVLDDYAFFAAGLLDLFEATGNARWLAAAIELEDVLGSQFWDGNKGGYFLTAAAAEELLVRDKPSYDGAEPSGNSVAILNLLRLYEFTSDEQYLALAEGAFRAFSSSMSRGGTGLPKMLSALDYYLDTPKEIVLVRSHPEDDFGPFLARLADTYLPNRAFMTVTEGDELDALSKLVPLVEGKRALDDQITAYVCERNVCELPTNDPDVFAKQIAKVAPYGP